jgi:enoyl-CoA hydratase
MSSNSYEMIALERTDRIARIVFNRPARMNAMNSQMMAELDDALDILESDDEVRVIILKGSGRTFCTGWDLSENGKRVEAGFADDIKHMKAVSSRARRLWDSPKVTIAQLHGWCIAGGLIFGMNCDLVYAADDTLIGQPEARSMGISPDFGLWPLTINIRRTKELVLTGDLIDGKSAADLGMINSAHPIEDLESYVEWMAARLASLNTETIALHKAALNQVAELQGLGSMWTAGFMADAIQHKQASRKEFAQLAAAEGPKAAVAHRDNPFGGAGLTTEGAWRAYRDSLVTSGQPQA